VLHTLCPNVRASACAEQPSGGQFTDRAINGLNEKENRTLAIREIRTIPDPVLRTECEPITTITPAIHRLVTDLLDTVDDPGRAGLSANQIGVSVRAFSYNIDGKVGYVLNPVLEETSGEQYGDEGCLSVPGLWYATRRADYARVRGIDLDGGTVVLEGRGIMGRMLQHEIDHLDGHVYLDRLEKAVRREAMRQLRSQR
jgi:peptide deformylase